MPIKIAAQFINRPNSKTQLSRRKIRNSRFKKGPERKCSQVSAHGNARAASINRMSDSAARNDEEKMPMNLRFDKALPYYIPGAGGSSVASSSISRESSFSSVDQDTAPLSRGSSFSSGSPGSTIDTDSSVSRSNSHRSTEDETLNEQRRRFRAARAQGVSSSRHAENGVTSTSIPARPSLLMQGRSSSAGSAKQCIASDGSRLSAPDALLISTPPGNSFMNFRCRSRSWNCNDAATGEEDAPSVEASSASPRKTSVVRTEKQNRTGSKESLAGRSHGENDATKRTQVSTFHRIFLSSSVSVHFFATVFQVTWNGDYVISDHAHVARNGRLDRSAFF